MKTLVNLRRDVEKYWWRFREVQNRQWAAKWWKEKKKGTASIKLVMTAGVGWGSGVQLDSSRWGTNRGSSSTGGGGRQKCVNARLGSDNGKTKPTFLERAGLSLAKKGTIAKAAGACVPPRCASIGYRKGAFKLMGL